MPQIGPDTWKVALEFFWYREFEDGRIEQEFDLGSGQPRLWGPKTPPGLRRVGWLPMTSDLAGKIRSFGEIGRPTSAPSVLINLKPDEKLICLKDCAIIKGYRVFCKVCGAVFREFGGPEVCPTCGARAAWRCDNCRKLQDTEICPDCGRPGHRIIPFDSCPDAWEDVAYLLGIEGKFLLKFNSKGLIVEH